MSLATNKTFMFTGRLSVTRNVAKDLLLKGGGTPGISVCSKTDYLVVGDKPGSKLGKAVSLGIPTISEKDFLAMLKDEELPIEEWAENDIKIIPVDVFESVLNKLYQRKLDYEQEERRKLEKKLNTIYSFESTYMLGLLLKEEPWLVDKIDFSPRICNVCSKPIPYTTQKSPIYCFNCHGYSHAYRHPCNYDQIHEKLESTTRSVKHGSYRFCSICGNVRFIKNADLIRKRESARLSDISYSAESVVRHIQSTAVKQYSVQGTRNTPSTYTMEEVEAVLIEIEKKAQRKDERRRQRHTERYNKQNGLDS